MNIRTRAARAVRSFAAGIGNHLHARLFHHMAHSGMVAFVAPNAITAELERIRQEVGGPIETLQAQVLGLQQRAARGGGSGDIGHDVDSLGMQAEAAFKADADLFRKTGRVGFTIKAQLTSPATGAHGSRDLSTLPGPNTTSLSALLTPGALDGLATLHYPRRTGVVGAAAVQANEGDVKATTEPVFAGISTNAATVAGLCLGSEQALATSGGLSRAIDSHLTRSIRAAIDNLLITGTAAPAWPFVGLVTLAGAFAGPATFTSLVDGILAAKTRMNLQGFAPSIVVLSEAGFLTTQLAKDSTGRYLTDAYLAALGQAVGGMRVALSAGIPEGKAMLVDSGFVGYLSSGAIRISIGTQNDQFARNLVTIKGEVEVLPWASDLEALVMATPAAA